MATVDVQRSYIESAQEMCKKCIEELNKQATQLNESYTQAGSTGWTDDKYVQLGSIIEDCVTALQKPVASLEHCKTVLQEIYGVVVHYEDTSLL